MSSLHILAFSGEILRRGFWLYVWEVRSRDGQIVLYIGRTGDSSSANAQSPFNRLSQHLGNNKHGNALRRQLTKAGIEPESCKSFEMTAYGPIMPEAVSKEAHVPCRDQIAALEKELRDALQAAGYAVLNKVNCRNKPDLEQWSAVLAAFAEKFPLLKQPSN